MRFLVIGSGGREHALGWKIAQEGHDDEIYFLPGNGGTSETGKNVDIAPTDFDAITRFAREVSADLVIVGPEDPLALGIVDKLEAVQHTLVREGMRMTGITGQLEITTIGDVPAGTGMGSSSSLTVGLLNALHAYKGEIAGRILTKLGQKDFQAELSQVRAANPGALFVFQPGGMGIAFMKQWAAFGMAKDLPLYTVFTIDEATLPAIGDAAVGTYHTSYWGPDIDNPANKDFVASFSPTRARYVRVHAKSIGTIPKGHRAVGRKAWLFVDEIIVQ